MLVHHMEQGVGLEPVQPVNHTKLVVGLYFFHYTIYLKLTDELELLHHMIDLKQLVDGHQQETSIAGGH